MDLKRKIAVFLFIFVIGTILGLLGLVDFNSTNKIDYLWPGAVIQSLAGVLFGMTGVIAGTAFPLFSDAISGLALTKVLIWIPANFIQSFIPFLTKKIFKFDPYTLNKKTFLCFFIGCVIISQLLGILVSAFGYYAFNEITTAKEYINVILNWLKSNIFVAIIFGPLLLKFFAPALKECEMYDEMETKAKV